LGSGIAEERREKLKVKVVDEERKFEVVREGEVMEGGKLEATTEMEINGKNRVAWWRDGENNNERKGRKKRSLKGKARAGKRGGRKEKGRSVKRVSKESEMTRRRIDKERIIEEMGE
jgi:hypothetical protein